MLKMSSEAPFVSHRLDKNCWGFPPIFAQKHRTVFNTNEGKKMAENNSILQRIPFSKEQWIGADVYARKRKRYDVVCQWNAPRNDKDSWYGWNSGSCEWISLGRFFGLWIFNTTTLNKRQSELNYICQGSLLLYRSKHRCCICILHYTIAAFFVSYLD